MTLSRALGPLILTGLAGCGGLDYTPMDFTVEGNDIVAMGEIDDGVLDRFRDVTSAHPKADTLVLLSVGGSVDDDANLIFSREVRARSFTTLVPADGLIASGGTDLFLAGTERVLEPGACVGVHSWSGGGEEGKDVPRNDPEHRKYLDYYREMGIPAAFYWFTLEAAPADEMHWMTAAEINRFGMTTEPATKSGNRADCDIR